MSIYDRMTWGGFWVKNDRMSNVGEVCVCLGILIRRSAYRGENDEIRVTNDESNYIGGMIEWEGRGVRDGAGARYP